MNHVLNNPFKIIISPQIYKCSSQPRLRGVSEKRTINGFTLIELLVVISIIAILASILMPVISLVRDMAMRTSCSSNMRQVYMALDSYRSDAEGLYPQVYWDDPSWNTWCTWTYQTTSGRWQHVLQDFTQSYKVFNCPKVAILYPNIAVLEVAKGGAPRGSAPANGYGSWATCAMAYNSQCFGRTKNWTWSVPGPMTTAKVNQYITDQVPTGTINRCPVFFDGTWQNDGSNQLTDVMNTYWPHRTVSNMVFTDGHMETRMKSQVVTYDALQMSE